MCLFIKRKSCKQTAKKDIVVYKVLEISGNCDELITFYKNFVVNIGDTYNAILNRSSNISTDEINSGLHSYAKLNNIFEYLEYSGIKKIVLEKEIVLKSGLVIEKDSNIYDYCGDCVVVVECVIPKGSSYYVGTFLKRKSYASDCLKYIKIL